MKKNPFSTKKIPLTLIRVSILFFLNTTLFAPALSAQVPYTPFPKGDISWQSRGEDYYGHGMYRFILSIDTALVTIDNKIYNKVSFAKYGSEEYIAGVREEDKKIYLYVPELGEHLIYDFGLEIGDTLVYTIIAWFNVSYGGNIGVGFYKPGEAMGIFPDIYFVYVAKEKGVITLENGEIRNTLIVDKYAWYVDNDDIVYYRYGSQKWIEGLGVIGAEGFLTPLACESMFFHTPLYLECICQNNSILFSTNNKCFLQINENLPQSINVYPNPTTGELQITNYVLNQVQGRIKSVEVFDVYGKSLLVSFASLTSPETTINISHLSAGIYFVKVVTEQGDIVKKIVKQ